MTDCNKSQEAREIAKKLRYVANDDLGGLSLQKNLAVITKAEDGSWRGVMRRLADLSDRPTGTATKAADGYAVCHTCGANFIVSAPAAFRCEEETEADYCPFCGTPLDWGHEDD